LKTKGPPDGGPFCIHAVAVTLFPLPHVTIYPRHRRLGPNAKRHCRFWLGQEYRVSGTVIVPRQRCWWQ
jgi:hypothetical protein